MEATSTDIGFPVQLGSWCISNAGSLMQALWWVVGRRRQSAIRRRLRHACLRHR